LNEGFEGGETKFVKKNISIKASVGNMLVWSNLKESDLETLDYESKHAGLPVISGEKWIAIVWVRQRNFR
jgi:prolyl 4-hydroxylase